MTNFAILNTVSVVQLVERQIVVLVVVGSSPTVHPPLRSCIARSLFLIVQSQCCPGRAHLQSSVFKLSKDLIDSIHEEGIVAYTS